jgi:hypothetical protein
VKAIIIRSSSVVALSLALTRIAVGEEKPVDSLAVLKRALSVRGNTTISVVKTSAGREVHYCTDNTCDIFKAPNSAPQGALADFAFTYIFYASGYTYLQDFVTKTGKQYSKAILDRNRSGAGRAAGARRAGNEAPKAFGPPHPKRPAPTGSRA